MANPTENLERMPVNIGHGHVYPRPDGNKARCGGPPLCPECARDAARKAVDEGAAKAMGKAEDHSQPSFPGTASMYAAQHRLAVTEEWMRGWNACLDAIDRAGGFRRG